MSNQRAESRRARTTAVLRSTLATTALASAAPATAATVSSAPAAAAPRSSCAPAAARDTTVQVPFDGTSYAVRVHIPFRTRATGRLPLVLTLHGSQNTGQGQLDYTGVTRTADANGFIVAAPQGAVASGSGYIWNVPQVTPTGTRDDVAYLSQVIDTLTGTLCADPARVYATGYSGGGRMASALACAIPDRLAAVAPVAGLRAGRPDPADDRTPDPTSCRPAKPVPVLAFHGQQDHTNPYDGGGAAAWRYPVPAALARWAELNGCRPVPATTPVTEHVTLTAYRGCRHGADTALCTVADGGHTWPGSPYESAGNGTTNREIDANDLMWQFFRLHHR
ncbi:polyhydroxybutyrate depolymerase [Kitasatospora herbaricolor]|uniref:extracellular catalytic domain type 1 short-chain-length polyhydroxyalkanoate depolymerase n=1 Tax=Kitasatospora herbaricolor TaxID=68217 RepID=UPI00199AF0A4|nr:PHB depolymerase family esterase [Kitasatospora herbaricolor]MDQ0306747.1 polyhydroxybutyrate depolymerase [Kitasatospora herbaricolor]GGV44505.1 polyhydroxybutyrate depolymerase [Kitasatospora herbaricolor]